MTALRFHNSVIFSVGRSCIFLLIGETQISRAENIHSSVTNANEPNEEQVLVRKESVSNRPSCVLVVNENTDSKYRFNHMRLAKKYIEVYRYRCRAV